MFILIKMIVITIRSRSSCQKKIKNRYQLMAIYPFLHRRDSAHFGDASSLSKTRDKTIIQDVIYIYILHIFFSFFIFILYSSTGNFWHHRNGRQSKNNPWKEVTILWGIRACKTDAESHTKRNRILFLRLAFVPIVSRGPLRGDGGSGDALFGNIKVPGVIAHHGTLGIYIYRQTYTYVRAWLCIH